MKTACPYCSNAILDPWDNAIAVYCPIHKDEALAEIDRLYKRTALQLVSEAAWSGLGVLLAFLLVGCATPAPETRMLVLCPGERVANWMTTEQLKDRPTCEMVK